MGEEKGILWMKGTELVKDLKGQVRLNDGALMALNCSCS